MWFSRVDSSRQCFSLWQPLFQFRSLDVSATGNILYQFCIDHYCFALSPVHTGNKVEFNTVDFVEPATNQWRIQRGATGQGGHAPPPEAHVPTLLLQKSVESKAGKRDFKIPKIKIL